MAQSSVTVTPPNPTPPTNFSSLGSTPPHSPSQAYADDGTAGTATVFAAKTASADNSNYPSVDAEGKGTETVVTSSVPNPSPAGQMVSFSCLGNFTSNPNQDHASSLSPAGAPTVSAIAPDNVAAGAGTTAITVTGTNFTPQSVVYVNGVAQTTVYVSKTSLTVAAAPKKATAGTLPVKVITAGTSESAAANWTFV